MHSWYIVLVVGTVLLGTYHVAHGTKKFVLGINARNGTLYLHDESPKRKDNTATTATTTTTTTTAANTAPLKSQPEVQVPEDNAPSHARAIHAFEWKEPDPTNWAAIEKKLDADLSSAANVRRWTEKINSISYDNPRKMNRTLQRSSTSQDLKAKNVSVRPNPLLMRLIDEENVLGETEKLIARVLAEKTYSKLSDMAATGFDNPDKNNAVVRNKESGTVGQALDELSASILADCKKLFGMMFGRGGEAMTSNENCLRMVGYSVKGKLEGDQGFDEAGEGMSYERKDNVNDTSNVMQEGRPQQRDAAGKQVLPEEDEENVKTSPQEKKNVTEASTAGMNNVSSDLINGSDSTITDQNIVRSSSAALSSTDRADNAKENTSSIASPSLNNATDLTERAAETNKTTENLALSNSTSRELVKNNDTAAVTVQGNVTREAPVNALVNGSITPPSNRSSSDVNDQVAQLIAYTDDPSLMVNETISRVNSLIEVTTDDTQNGATAASDLLKREELVQNTDALNTAVGNNSKTNESLSGDPVGSVTNNSSSGTISSGDVPTTTAGATILPSGTTSQNESTSMTPATSTSGELGSGNTTVSSSSPVNASSTVNLITPAASAGNATTPDMSGMTNTTEIEDFGLNENATVTPNNVSSSLLNDEVAEAAISPDLQSSNASDADNKTLGSIDGSVIYGNFTANDYRPEQSVMYENSTNLSVNPTISSVSENSTEEITEIQEVPSNMFPPFDNSGSLPLNETSAAITPGNATESMPEVSTAALVPENSTTSVSDSVPTNLTAPVSYSTDYAYNASTTEVAAPSPSDVTPSAFPQVPPPSAAGSNDTVDLAGLSPTNVTSPATAAVENPQLNSNATEQGPAVDAASPAAAAQPVPSNSSTYVADSEVSPVPVVGYSAGNVSTFPLYARLFPENLTVPISNSGLSSTSNVQPAYTQGVILSNMTASLFSTPSETVNDTQGIGTNGPLTLNDSSPVVEAGPSPIQNNESLPAIAGTTVAAEEPTSNAFPMPNLADAVPENVTVPSVTVPNALNSTSPIIMITGAPNAGNATVVAPVLNLASATAPIVSTGLPPANTTMMNSSTPDINNIEPTFRNVTTYPLYTVVTDNITNATTPINENLTGPLLVVNILGSPYANTTAPFPPPPMFPQNESQALPLTSPAGSETSAPPIPPAPPPANEPPPASFLPPSSVGQVDNVNASYLNTSNSSQNNSSTMNNSTVDTTTTTTTNVTENLDPNGDLEKNVIARYSNRTIQQQYSTSASNSTNTTEFIGYQLAKSAVPSLDERLTPSTGTVVNKRNAMYNGKSLASLNRKRFRIPLFPNGSAPKSRLIHEKFRNVSKQRRMFLPSNSRQLRCNRVRCLERRYLFGSLKRKGATRGSSKRSLQRGSDAEAKPFSSRIRTKRSKSLNAHRLGKSKKHRIRKARKHAVRSDEKAGNKRRLVSNHVPHHKDSTNQKFKVLSDEKNVGNKTKAAPKTNPAPPQANNASSTNETTKQEVTNDLLSSGKDNGNVRPTLTPLAMPTIAQSGINESRDSVLQKGKLDGKPSKMKEGVALGKEESESYATDDRFPHLGLLPHAKGHEGISNDDTHEDPVARHSPPVFGSPPSSNLENLNAPSPPLAPPADTNGAENQSATVKEEPTKRILCFGDSLTKGGYAGDQIHHPYTVKLRQLFKENKKGVNYHIINHGMTGDRCVSKKMKRRLTDDLDNLPPLDLVVILAGTEDLIHEDCARDVELFEQIKTLHKLVQDKGYKSAVVTIPESKLYGNGTDRMTLAEYKDAIEDVNQKLRMYAATEKLPLCDLADEFPRYEISGNTRKLEDMWDDSVHPNKLGYDRIGEIIYSDIRAYV